MNNARKIQSIYRGKRDRRKVRKQRALLKSQGLSRTKAELMKAGLDESAIDSMWLLQPEQSEIWDLDNPIVDSSRLKGIGGKLKARQKIRKSKPRVKKISRRSKKYQVK